MSGNTRAGVWLVMTGNVLFSAKAIFAKLIFRYDVDPTTLMTLRLGFSFPFFAIAAIWALKRNGRIFLSGKDWQYLLLFAFLGYYGASFLNFIGLRTVTAGLERLILFTYPTMVLVLMALLRGIRITAVQGWALILTYGGILLVLIPGLQASPTVGIGAIYILGSALSFALYLVFVGDYIQRLGSVLFTSIVLMLAAGMTALHFALTRSISVLVLPWEVYGLFLGLAVVSTVIPVFMISEGIRRLGASNTSIIASIGPVATIVLAYIFLGEPITALQLLGTTIVLIGVWLVSSRKDRPLSDTPIRVR